MCYGHDNETFNTTLGGAAKETRGDRCGSEDILDKREIRAASSYNGGNLHTRARVIRSCSEYNETRVIQNSRSSFTTSDTREILSRSYTRLVRLVWIPMRPYLTHNLQFNLHFNDLESDLAQMLYYLTSREIVEAKPPRAQRMVGKRTKDIDIHLFVIHKGDVFITARHR